MSLPRVTVVIPAYNAEKYLRETVNSVLAQTLSDWQLVIVDDGSKDKTFDLAQQITSEDARISAILQANQGVSIARNSGMSAGVASEYIAFLDADDIWLPNMLKQLIAKMEESTDNVAAHGLGKFIDSEGQDIRLGECEQMCRKRPTVENGRVRASRADEPTTLEALIVSGCVVCPASVLMKRAVVESIGGFDKNYSICADWNIYIRLARHGNLGYLDEVVLGYRQHASNMSGNSTRQRDEQRQVISEALASGLNSASHEQRIKSAYVASQKFYLGDKFRLAAKELQRLQFGQAARQLGYGARNLVNILRRRP